MAESMPVQINDHEQHLRLVQAAAFAPSRAWMDAYFELANCFLEDSQVTGEDRRLAMTAPKTPPFKLSITIGSRFALGLYWNKWAPASKLAAIFPGEATSQPDFPSGVIEGTWRFGLLPGEEPGLLPELHKLNTPTTILESSLLLELFLQACRCELERGKGSPLRRFHQPVVFQAASDTSYRTLVLDEAFP